MGVRLVPVQGDEAAARRLSGLIQFRSETPTTQEMRAQAPIPALILCGDGQPGQPGLLSFTDSAYLDDRLRGGLISGEWSPDRLRDVRDCEVLAAVGESPAWIRCHSPQTYEVVSVDARELAAGERLRDRVEPGNCLALIALIQFLRAVVGQTWSAPPLRAGFVVDDPNLHWRTYGYVNFAEILEHATSWGHHMTFATIPLDLRFADPRTVKLFRSGRRHISLTMHGNNHTHHELASPSSAAQADSLLAQALRRTAKFEARTGLAVARVMIPPHEAWSTPVVARLPKLDFEAASLNQAHGWLPSQERSAADETLDNPSAGFGPAEVTEFGTPVLIRRAFSQHQEALLRGFLDQPVVLYGHAEDFRDGLGFLETATAAVNRLPGVVWSDIASLSRSCYLTRRSGSDLHVRPFTRRLKVAVPPDVRTVVVEPLLPGRPSDGEANQPSGNGIVCVPDAARTTLALGPAERETSLDIQLLAKSRIRPDEVLTAPRAGKAVLRRFATEARDRLQPLSSKRAQFRAWR